MSDFEIKVEIPEGLLHASEILDNKLKNAVTNATLAMEREVKTQAPYGVTGHLKQAITSNVEPLTSEIRGIIGVPRKPGIFVEEGTRPHTPPRAPVFRWAEKKGLNKWAVWTNIRKKGTKANPFIKRSFLIQEQPARRRIEQAVADAVKEMGR
ncbi:hypothetical protein [Alicyclobacillus sp. ALC3]|uniref:hypothetical protein n=1 Tax=Alicyclobacillus sp. ALC3 TaxID=2796143 RepID=UPI002379EB7A|nr:hypothetical protein [Alicyclobacillus sp. ALC3]WDL97803.1 hypothetical protein JC200_03470 [Alicyclobacillus sp. ALC3]